MKKIAIVLVTAMLFAGTVFAASAFTSAELTRSATIDVAADDSGVITLTPGSPAAVSINSSGELVIDTSTANANGLNVSGAFTYGDNANPTTTSAFQVTNNSGESQSFTVGYSYDTAPAGGTLTYTFYDDTGSIIDTVTASSDGTVDLAAGETAYVVMDADTNGASSGDSFTGNLSISA